LSQETASLQSPTESEHPAVDCLRVALNDTTVQAILSLGQASITIDRESIVEATTALRDDLELKYTRLSDISAIDNLERRATPRFEVVYHLYSYLRSDWVRLRVPIEERDEVVPSIVSVWPAANWFEREVYDMFGIHFAGHPQLTRILMPDDWEGFPLRKDYPMYGEDVEFTVNQGRVKKKDLGYG
jgi:NADH-quinone oxidoreductase subunit C